MGLQMQAWETTLLTWAYGALNDHIPIEQVKADHDTLAAAYRYCEEITRVHSRTFFLASGLLPREKRLAARALYAFCRVTDDIIDEGDDLSHDARLAALDNWHRLVFSPHPPAHEPVALAWADARARFNIPHGYVRQLIDGVSRDLTQTRYETFEDMAEYAYGVASTVGLMAMHIIGFSSADAIPYAVKLGVALQLTNILRDVGTDWRMGRLYLPLNELKHHNLSEADIADGHISENWQRFMRYQIERTHCLYEEALPGIALLNPDGRFAIAAAAELYRAILDDIETHDYDVFHRRAHVSKVGKLRRLPGIWLRSRSIAPNELMHG
jgi:phytoene synthase